MTGQKRYPVGEEKPFRGPFFQNRRRTYRICAHMVACSLINRGVRFAYDEDTPMLHRHSVFYVDQKDIPKLDGSIDAAEKMRREGTLKWFS